MSTESTTAPPEPAAGESDPPLLTPTPPADRAGLVTDLKHVGCGILMGAADVVPGVSGGTIALVLNVYARLVNAITRVERKLLTLVLDRDFRGAAQHIDLRFIAPLGLGIGTGILSLASLMHFLLEHYERRTNAVFCGLILASTLIVSRRIRAWDTVCLIVFLGGAAGAAWLVGIPALTTPPAGLWYLFVCGMIGICAMILPGISGAFILLILGRYKYITGILKAVLHGEISLANLTVITVFCLGCLTGILSFSRLLKWLLARYHDLTMALLCGFMLGSLRKLWPLTWPPEESRETVFLATLFVMATAVVLLIDLYARLRRADQEATAS